MSDLWSDLTVASENARSELEFWQTYDWLADRCAITHRGDQLAADRAALEQRVAMQIFGEVNELTIASAKRLIRDKRQRGESV